MRFLRRIEKRLVSADLFGYTDRRLSRRLRPEDSLVIAGFWRSGTTLLLELLAQLTGGRSFFEPLHFRVARAQPFHGSHRFSTRGRLQGETYPYVSPATRDRAVDQFFEDVLCGRVSSAWTRKARRARQLLGARVLVKMVRGNLLVAYLEQTFRCRSVFIVRHPCAVVASLRRGMANQAIYGSKEFLEILLRQPELRASHLDPYWDHIQRWNTSPLHRMALVHAVTNCVPLRQMRDGVYHPCLVRFEELVIDPRAAAMRLGVELGLVGVNEPSRQGASWDSLTTRKSREGVMPATRAWSWKSELERSEIDAVYAIYAGFDPVLAETLAGIDRLEPPR